MPFQLNPSKVPIWKSENNLTLGLQADAQELIGVTNAQERLINLLFQGVAEDQLELVGNEVGLNEIETNQLVERLKPSLLKNNSITGSKHSFDARFAEIIRIGFETDVTPESILIKRAETLIQIPHLNRTGLLLIRALAEAGFRNFETTDFNVVSRVDGAELGYQENQLGISRLAAARELLESHRRGLQLKHPESRVRKNPDLILISAMHQVNPRDYRELKIPHIAIEYGIEELRITPVIVPGLRACIGCRDLWEVENDIDWASKAIQLTSRNDQLDDGIGLLMSAAIAAKTSCAFVDKPNSTTGFRINLKTRAVSEYGWQYHPSCNCKLRE